MADAIKRGEEFLARVKEAEGDRIRLADLMAEAIAMNADSRPLEIVGHDGRTHFSMEELQSFYCMDAAAKAYLLARGGNA